MERGQQRSAEAGARGSTERTLPPPPKHSQVPLMRRQSSVMWQCCKEEAKRSISDRGRRKASTYSIGDHLDFRPSFRWITALPIPELVDGSVAVRADALALREDALLEEARVGLGGAVALVPVTWE